MPSLLLYFSACSLKNTGGFGPVNFKALLHHSPPVAQHTQNIDDDRVF
jgi:hypothetical protein